MCKCGEGAVANDPPAAMALPQSLQTRFSESVITGRCVMNQYMLKNVLSFVDEETEPRAACASRWFALQCSKNAEARMDMPCARPQGPWTVDLANGSDYSDGSSEHPFRSVRRAACCAAKCTADGRRGILPWVRLQVRCGPTCKLLACSTAQCDQRICAKHGDGEGVWNDDYGKYEYESYECAHTGCDHIFCLRCAPRKLHACEFCSDCWNFQVSECGIEPEFISSADHYRYCDSHITPRWAYSYFGESEEFLMCRECERKCEELDAFDEESEALEQTMDAW